MTSEGKGGGFQPIGRKRQATPSPPERKNLGTKQLSPGAKRGGKGPLKAGDGFLGCRRFAGGRRCEFLSAGGFRLFTSHAHLTLSMPPTSQLPPVAGRDLPPLRGGQQPVVPRSEARGEGTRKRSAAGRGLLNAGDGCLVCHLSRMGAVASLRVPAGLGCSPHRVVPR